MQRSSRSLGEGPACAGHLEGGAVYDGVCLESGRRSGFFAGITDKGNGKVDAADGVVDRASWGAMIEKVNGTIDQ